jgi:hypothetical protein
MSSIRLRTNGKGELAENPLGVQLTYCPRCGGEGRELVMTGNRRRVYTCGTCKTENFGALSTDKCGKCGGRFLSQSREIKENEKLPGGLCEACEKEVEAHKKVVAEGGIYFRCAKCGVQGVIKNTAPICQLVREKQGPDYVGTAYPCGIEFNECDQHGG